MRNAIICFTRVPRPGTTKTRLLGLLSADQCVRLHWAFLQDLAQVYSNVDAHLFVAHTPDSHWEELRKIFPDAASFFPQEGNDLGAKMHHAISAVLDLGYDAVILTGADLPLMTKAHLDSGFSCLEQADVTIGPNPDGGYYLIGMKSPHEEIFHVPSYGGATVYENTVAALRRAGLMFSPALSCGDVDTPDGLRALFRIINPESATGQCLLQFQKEGVAL